MSKLAARCRVTASATVLIGPVCHWTRNASAHYMPTDAQLGPMWCLFFVLSGKAPMPRIF